MALPPQVLQSILQQQGNSPGAAASVPFQPGPPQQPVGGVLPPTSPIPDQLPLQASMGQPQPTGTPQGGVAPQPAAMSSQDPLMQLYQQSIGRGTQAIENLRGLGHQQAAVPTATAWHPHYEHGQGAGGFFHNLGQALMSIGLATRHGQELQQAMARGPQQQRAQEIEGIQAQVAPEKEAVDFEKSVAQGAGGLAYKQGMLGVRQEGVDVARDRANTYAKRVAEQGANDLAKQAQGWQRLSQAQQKQQFQQWYDKQLIDVARERVAAGMSENEARVSATRDVAAALQGNKIVNESPVLSSIMQSMGLSEYMPTVQVPSGASTQSTKPGEPSTPRASKAAPTAPGQHKVGDTVVVHGKTVKIGKIYPDGTFDPAP